VFCNLFWKIIPNKMQKRELMEEHIIDSSKFIDANLCIICRKLVYTPVCCSNCEGGVFCLNCIEEYVQKNDHCFTQKCKTFSQKNIPRIIAQLFDELKFSCIYSYRGCQQIINYSNFLPHADICEYGFEKCKFCGLEMKIEEIENHIHACDLAEVKCENCEEKFTVIEYASHKIETCIKTVFLKHKKERDEFHAEFIDEFKENKKIIRRLVEENLTQKEKLYELSDSLEKIVKTVSKLQSIQDENISLNLKLEDLSRKVNEIRYSKNSSKYRCRCIEDT
jgi:hypothetical protein